MQYKNHFESVYCIEGSGILTSIAEEKDIDIEPGTLYLLDKHDKHILRAKTEMKMACVFNPALFGHETHDETGSYEACSRHREGAI